MPNPHTQVDGRTPRARRIDARRRQVHGEQPPGQQPVTDPTLAQIGIPERYRDDLTQAGIRTLAQLQAFGDLTQIKGIGPKASQEIIDAVVACVANPN
jgi:predicted flap endonuclease-1-like 5' DNA nuclease